MHAESAATSQPAPRWRRFAALGYDLLATLAVLMVTVMACLLVTGGRLDHGAAWYRLTLLAATGTYFVVSWIRGGQTLGMRPWRIRLTDRGGGRIGPGRALLRFTVMASPLLLLALNGPLSPEAAMLAPPVAWFLFFAVALVDRRGRALQDLVAGTELRH